MQISGRLAAGSIVLTLTLGFATPAGALKASQPVSQILQSAIKATEAANSVTFTGTVRDAKHVVTLNVSTTRSGNGEGTIDEGNGAAAVRAIKGTIYFRGSTTFWRQQGGKAAAQLFAGRWVSTAATSVSGKSLAQFFNFRALFESTFGTASTTFTKAGISRIENEKALAIAGQDDSDKSSGKIYIALTGRPYVLQMVLEGSGETGTINFTNYNHHLTKPVAPANAINLDTLGRTTAG